MLEGISVYVNGQKVCTLKRAAFLADRFVLTHKTVFIKGHVPPSPTHQVSDRSSESGEAPSLAPSVNTEKLCFYCHKTGPVVADCITLKHTVRTKPPWSRLN